MQIDFGIEQDTIGALYKEGTFFGSAEEFNSDGGFLQGVLVERMPYAVRDDVIVMSLLIISFLLLCYVISNGWGTLVHGLKDFFVYRKRQNMFVETGQDFRYQAIMFTHSVFMLSLLFYAGYLASRIPSYESRIIPFAMLVGGVLVFYFLKYLLYFVVNWTFFGMSRTRAWTESYQSVLSLQGLLLVPVVLLAVFSDLGTHVVMISLAVVLVVSKMMLFVRSCVIFFDSIFGLFCNILYLCTLELIPAFCLLKVVGIYIETL